MRPVLLRLAGFASFREPAVVDFRGADYFVLVGPTGAGKSTVIDAMTFALYGSVPRWDDRRTVGLALAPTTARATVSLVFEADGERYVAARELRRAASGAVAVKDARLERLADRTGTAELGEQTVPIAEGAQVTKQVQALLGLGFDDFCTCVVLPQGDFADFLHAPANQRQEKLEQILGLGVYDRVMRRANQEASRAQQQVELLGEQLDRYCDATADAETAAAARVAALDALVAAVAAAAPAIEAAAAEVAAQQVVAARLRTEREQLVDLGVPGGVAELDRARRDAAEAAERAAAGEQAADQVDLAAREALAGGPDRARLERVRSAHAELDAAVAGLPGLVERHGAAAVAYATAAADATAARAALEDTRKARDAARDTAGAMAAEAERLAAERDLLGVPPVPDGLADLDRRRAAADAAVRETTATLAVAEETEHRARAAADAAPARGPLEETRRGHAELDSLRERHAQAQRARAAADEAARVAGERRAATADALDGARGRLDALQRADLAATLRPALVVGQDCPVCAQAVAALPPALPVADLRAARQALAAAEREHEQRRAAEAAAASRLAVATAEAQRLSADIDAAQAALAGAPDAAGVVVALAERERLDHAVAVADAEARAARRARDEAVAQAEGARSASDAAAERLRAVRDPLVPLGAPALPAGDVTAGWCALAGWARAAAAERDGALAALRQAHVVAGAELTAAEAAFGAAGHAEARCREAETAAARAEQDAAGHLAAAQQRIAQLRAELADAPTADEAAAGLARLATLEREAGAAAVALSAARAASRDARQFADEVAGRVAAAWEVLRVARDPLVALGAPVLDGDALGPAWERLAGWSAAAVRERDARIVEVTAAIEAAHAERQALARQLTGALAAHDVDPGPGVLDPARAALVATAALGAARGAHARIVERRAEAEALTAARATAQEEQQVARLLGQQLRSDRFPRWLVASALDALVADASTILSDLSGGQFALTHDRGDFLVVDHADADAHRPVKTLSGGETFQASLALALALSAQMSGLAARGAARLESIFLDEGFGTLDEANLDVVATTLETLAAGGDRMVGVVTHVPALAERVPVRFVVGRDSRSSTISRVER